MERVMEWEWWDVTGRLEIENDTVNKQKELRAAGDVRERRDSLRSMI